MTSVLSYLVCGEFGFLILRFFFFPNRNPLACFLQYAACISFRMRLLAFYLRECRMMWTISFPAEVQRDALKPLCFRGQKPCQFMAAHQIPGVQISFSNRQLKVGRKETLPSVFLYLF